MTDELLVSNQDGIQVIVLSGITDTITETEVVTNAIESTIESGIVTIYDDKLTYIESKDDPPTLINTIGVGPPGPPGPIGDGVFPPQYFNINQNTTSYILDTLDVLNHRTCKWIVNISDDYNTRFRCCEVLMLNHNSHCSFVVYSSMGSQIQHKINIELIGNDINMTLDNYENVDLKVGVIRIGMLFV